jgi:hypothetical protein
VDVDGAVAAAVVLVAPDPVQEGFTGTYGALIANMRSSAASLDNHHGRGLILSATQFELPALSPLSLSGPDISLNSTTPSP